MKVENRSNKGSEEMGIVMEGQSEQSRHEWGGGDTRVLAERRK